MGEVDRVSPEKRSEALDHKLLLQRSQQRGWKELGCQVALAEGILSVIFVSAE